jgi:hypothetical protein
MTPKDHNKTLGIIYSFLGGLLTIAALVELVRVIMLERELERIRSSTGLQLLILVGLLLTVFLFITASGLLRRRRWAKVLALILSALLVWLFPLGTALAIYTWWFLHSAGYRQMVSDSTDQQ